MRVSAVRFGADLWQLLNDEAALVGVSVAQYVREASLARAAAAAAARGEDPLERLAAAAQGRSPAEPVDASAPKRRRTPRGDVVERATAARRKATAARTSARAVRAQSEQAARHAQELAPTQPPRATTPSEPRPARDRARKR